MPRRPHLVTSTWRLPDGPGPIRHRIADVVVERIKSGRLRPGDQLPPTRVLARELGVARSAALAAYDELRAAGFVESTAGSATLVAHGADRAALGGARPHVVAPAHTGPAHPVPRVSPIRWDLRTGRPDPALIDPVAWRRAWRPSSRLDVAELARYVPEHRPLRTALADHLRRTRAVICDPDGVLVVPGIAACLPVLAAVLCALDRANVAIEDPGYLEGRPLLERGGLRLRPIAIDSDGLDPAHLGSADRCVYVTPAHQYPLGARMPVDRRADLISWAERTDGLIIEDDYDGEFRYDVSPLPALHSLDGAPDRVIYLGTTSKLLSPALRVAWVLPPPWLLAPLRQALAEASVVVNLPTGEALTRLLTSGALVAHHARASRTYAARRAAVVAAFRRRLPLAPLAGIDAGLHLVVRLPDDSDDHALAATLADAGVLLRPLSSFCVERRLSGLVLGYARLPETRAEQVVAMIAQVIAANARSR
ncbi:MAG: PLP-dependent aminotransferase family protein [Tetrasphaera sp.]